MAKTLAQRRRYIELFFLIFFCVGFAGTVISASHDLFLRLFPAALILSIAGIFMFHEQPVSIRDIVVFSMVVLSGFLIEVAGVNTHLIFGEYTYGSTLGFKLFNTPLLIGLNWLMLTYVAASVAEKTSFPVPLKIIFASLLMVLYDVILEKIAPALDMWSWKDNTVPFRNYAAWFITGLVFQAALSFYGIKARNAIAWKIVVIQLLFFTSLLIFYKLNV